MTTKLDRTRTLLRGAGALALVGVALLGLSALSARAQEKPGSDPGIWITEVDKDADTGQVQILLNVGRDTGLERGDALDVEREGNTIAHASVIES